MSDTAIKVTNLKKQYRLGTIGGNTLNAELQSWWARKRGKEDPNLKLGQNYNDVNERFYALNGIDFEVKKGEALGIIGANGAGKSTLLKILSRVTAPTEGDIWLNGRISSMLEVGTGFHPELTGRENIYMNGAILGMTKKEVDEKIESIIDFSECREFIDTPVKRYSSGMYVKLAFAVASHLDSEILVMDEVLAVGDMKFQKKCLGKMGDVAANEGRTVLYVSHNMATIRNLCTRCIVLEKGKIIFDGEVEDAIKVYMSFGQGEKITEIDNREFKRPNFVLGTKAQITHVSLVGKDTAVYNASEKVRIKIRIKSLQECKNVHMGISLFYADLNCIGFGSDELFDLEKDNEYEASFELGINNLPAGEYCLKMNLHVQDVYGNFGGSIDQTDFISFEVIDDIMQLVWHREWWGNYRLKDFCRIDN